MKKIILLAAIVMPVMAHAQVADSSKRLVKLEGAINFRDVGGYRTANGKTVKWGKVYRSADVSKLTDNDLQQLAGRHINTVIDLRETNEAAKAPDRLLPYTDYTLSAASQDVNMSAMMKNVDNGDSLITTFYANIDHYDLKYKAMFHKLLELSDTSALMFHCTAGKDRTGIGTALFLTALGVPYATIEKDYLATDVYRAKYNEQMIAAAAKQYGVKESVLRSMMGTKPAYLKAAFDAIYKKYGTMDAFFSQVLELNSTDLKQLKAKYTM